VSVPYQFIYNYILCNFIPQNFDAMFLDRYTMLGGQRGLPPFELLSNAELDEQRQAAAGAAAAEARQAAQQDIATLSAEKADVEDEKSFYYMAAVL
jgi:hypothetical protein